MILEKRGLVSEVDPDSPPTRSNRYVLTDITSFFTLLVGIYFPSVTGSNKRLQGHVTHLSVPVDVFHFTLSIMRTILATIGAEIKLYYRQILIHIRNVTFIAFHS